MTKKYYVCRFRAKKYESSSSEVFLLDVRIIFRCPVRIFRMIDCGIFSCKLFYLLQYLSQIRHIQIALFISKKNFKQVSIFLTLQKEGVTHAEESFPVNVSMLMKAIWSTSSHGNSLTKPQGNKNVFHVSFTDLTCYVHSNFTVHYSIKPTINTLNKSFIVSDQHVGAFGIGPALLYSGKGLPLALFRKDMRADSWSWTAGAL